MAGEEKPQILDLRRAKMLAAMGVGLWHLRPAPADARKFTPTRVDHVRQSALAEPEPTDASVSAAKASALAPQPEARPELETRTEPETGAVPAPVPLEFAWAKGAATLLVARTAPSAAARAHARDVLRYADWRARHTAPGAFKTGEFKWPQLLDTTTGTPARALAVFIEKHFPDESPWFLVADDLVDELRPWLGECLPGKSGEKVLVLHRWDESVTDAVLKKQIWQTLQQIA
ncbi:MAG: hypothetical protein ACFHXK_15110 [bacterium]